MIKWHYKKTEGIYFVPRTEYSKAREEINPEHESDKAKVLSEIPDNVRMHDNVWWFI